MQPNEQVVLVGPPGWLSFECPDPGTVVVTNHSEQPAAFAVFVTHRAIATMTRVPWTRLLSEARQPGGPKRILTAFLGAANQHLLKDSEPE
jgi:hypothetical protein